MNGVNPGLIRVVSDKGVMYLDRTAVTDVITNRDYILDTDLEMCYHRYYDDGFSFGFSSFS